ncbi:MAG: FAD-linked oxidase C-terminal domain-containing protein [Phycisphaerales bacterium]|nr:FAD-linked oxidase C-terminal domain-containing protein [Phycisphaerales bacterium]
MELPVITAATLPSQTDCETLASQLQGDVRFGQHDRMLYATDASMYQVEPLGVVRPAHVEDIVRVLVWCREHGLPVLPRGGGTSLSGQTVNAAIVIDCAPNLCAMGVIDTDHRSICVEPGVVLDDLQQHSAKCGLRFGPEVSTSTHATLGGMIANRSAGLHSLKWGMTDEHVLGLDVVLIDGRRVQLCRGAAVNDSVVADLTAQVAAVIEPLADEIDAKYPRLRRNVGGYALDRILDDLRRSTPGTYDRVDLSGLFAGAEGTLGFVVGARLNLVPLPQHVGLSVFVFKNVSAALSALTDVLQTNPAAVELLDSTILTAAREHGTYRKLAELLPEIDGQPAEAALYVDWFADDVASLEASMKQAEEQLPGVGVRRCLCPQEQADLWKLRKVGLGLILTADEYGHAVGGLEDCAVPPEQLAAFQSEFEAMLGAHGLSATYYAHASVGLLHIRPRINLHTLAGRDLLVHLAHEATELVRRYGGTVSGEHGDGRIRAAMMHEFYGPKLVQAFCDIKAIFDPNNRMNPGNIITDPGMVSHLRVLPNEQPLVSPDVDTWFRWDTSFLDSASACNGNALCRKTTSGAMCPSYRATRDERHATRGRANALRLAISGQFGGRGKPDWSDVETLKTLDLCLGCKACQYECPAAVDVATMKAEFLAQSMRAGRGPSIRTRLKGNVRRMNQLGSALHPISTLLIQHGPTAWLIKRLMGVARSRTLPGFSRALSRKHGRSMADSTEGPVVVLYADCFTTWTESAIGRDAIRLLEAFGYRVVIPDVGCCGRTQISSGLLDDAVRVISKSARAIEASVNLHNAVAVVAVEPSCATAMQQEWMQLKTPVPIETMKRIASLCDTVEGFLASHWGEHPQQPRFATREEVLPIHQHCHQKHRGELTELFLRRCGWNRAKLLDTGCCGMAGAFGYDQDHDPLSRAIGAESLSDLCGHMGPVAANGTSCRHQTLDVMQLTATHPVALAIQNLEATI